MKIIRAYLLKLVLVVSFLSSFATAHAQQPPAPPAMPSTGPGGYNYPHASATVQGPYWPDSHEVDNNYRYFFFEPAGPKPETAPVVLFLHGYFARELITYYAWMTHLARKGYVVVWIQYDVGTTLPSAYLGHVLVSWQDALERLENQPFEDHVRPERDGSGEPRTAIVGHSLGGYLAMGVAAWANEQEPMILIVPRPQALVMIEPGGWHVLPTPKMYKVRPETRLLILAADEDTTVCKETAINIWNSVSQIPPENKDFLFLLSDHHGQPEQIANHFFPNTSGYGDTAALDGRDFYVTFKLAVGALNCVFTGRDCAYAFGNGSQEQLGMGKWSDGVDRIPMVWLEDPSGLQTTCTDVPVPDWGAGTAEAASPAETAKRRRSSGPLNSLLSVLLPMLVVIAWRTKRFRTKEPSGSTVV